MKRHLLCFLSAVALCSGISPATGGDLYRCPGNDYKTTITASEAQKLGCRFVSEENAPARPSAADIRDEHPPANHSQSASAARGFKLSSPDESRLVEHGSYRNHDGVIVHSPAHSKTSTVPDGASAHCRDGTYSFSLHHSGTCSHHGGVASWL